VCRDGTLGRTNLLSDIQAMEYGMQIVRIPRTVILIPRIQTPYRPPPPVKSPEEHVESSEESEWRNYFRELGRRGGQKTSDRKRQAARLNAHRRWRRVRENKAAALALAANSPQ
jgi:hypothetical protein